MKAHGTLPFLALLSLFCTSAQGDDLPAGYTGPTLVSAQTSDYLAISQMTFKPGDPNHIYAARYNFGFTNSFITRYDYNPLTGQVSAPLTVATVPGAVLGLSFFNNDLYVSNDNTTTHLGGIYRLQPGAGGLYTNAVEFVNNIPTGLHEVDQLQIHGNSLYVGIGTQTDQATAGQESVYNGTVGIITDLTKANYSSNGANNLALSNVLTDTDPGKLHVYASGFRNPFGLLVTDSGKAWVSDNGQDNPVHPDLVYKDLQQGDQGTFPSVVTGAHPVSPFATVGDHVATTGMAVVPLGGNQGDIIMGLFHHDTSNPNPPLGNEVVLIDHNTGAVKASVTSLPSVTTIITDSTGRILMSDFGPNYDTANAPGGIYALTPLAIPEPSPLHFLLIALPCLVVYGYRLR